MTNGRTVEIIPAILVKSRKDLLDRIMRVAPFVKTVQLDLMDGVFVPNTTTLEVQNLPQFASGASDQPKGPIYEYHWMVEKPWEHIEKLGGPGIHVVHVETIHSREEWELVKTAAAKHNAVVGLALNPETYLDKIYPYAQEISRVLIMTVKPGFDGQKYMPEMEKKMADARAAFPNIDIEIDGGVNLSTIPGARKAGVNLFAAASAIFGKPDWNAAVKELYATAKG